MARDLISNKEEINSNMFHATMKDGICTDICGTDIVAVDNRSDRHLYPKLLEEVANPSELRGCRGYGTVVGFSG